VFKHFAIIILVVLFVGLIIPQVALAGRFPFEGPLVPCGTETNPEKCNLCHIFELAQNIIDLFITIIVFIAPLMIVIGGIILLTSADVPARVEQGKKIITYTITGLVITFLAWVIINTIMIKLVNPDVMPWPWNDITCEPAEPIEEEEEEGANYCTCQEEVENYTLIKATRLSDAKTCDQECRASRSTTYCNFGGIGSQLTCRSEEDLAQTSAMCLKWGFNYERIGPVCYPTANECANAIFSGVYRRCENLPAGTQCICYDGNNYPGPPPFPCQTNEFAIFRVSPGGYVEASNESVISCSEKQHPDNENCRLCALGAYLGGYPWCQRPAPAGSENWVLNPPPGGARPEQKGDASARLTNFINCMYSKLPDLTINSISSNVLCDDPNCDISQPGVCGHSAYSCHFGGINCMGESYAVDFHTNVSCSDIKQAAKECDSTAWVNWETNHTHVSVNGRACGCNESEAGIPCP